MQYEEMLINKAADAMKNSYAKYSSFNVGAALLCENGTIYKGCNIENASFSATVCAERIAVFSAVSAGETHFSAIAVVGGKNGEIDEYCFPCGICRQVLSEFCGGDFLVILYDGKTIKKYTLKELLPFEFGSQML